MRLAAGLAVGLLLVAALGVGEAGAAPFEEPVSVTATAPASVGAGVPFPLKFEVAAEAGALAIAAAPLRLRVKFEPECGGSFAGTEGPVAIDRVLPAPAPGTAYSQTINATPTLTGLGPETVCAFLEDSQERQFATDGEEELTVVAGGGACTTATQTLAKLKRNLKKLDRRIHKLRQRLRHDHKVSAKKRQAELRHLKKLRKRRHRLAHRKRAAAHLVTISCGSGG